MTLSDQRDQVVLPQTAPPPWLARPSRLSLTASFLPDGEALAGVISAARTAAADIAVVADAEQKVIHVSDSFTAITGYSARDVLGRTCRILQGPGTDKATISDMRQVLASGGVFDGEILNYRKDGSAFWAALRVTPLRLGSSAAITHYVSVQRDISNRVALLDQLQSQALRDHLTGLPNRSAAEQAIDDALRRSGTSTSATFIGLIDLDDFRSVNTIHGHAAGDDVLRQWSERMRGSLQEGDILARMGGDEFLLILERTGWDIASDEMARALDRLYQVVEEPFRIGGQNVSIGMSMGLVLVPRERTDHKSILQSADTCLYEMKARRTDRRTWWRSAALAQASGGPAHSTTRERTGRSAPVTKGLLGSRVRGITEPPLLFADASVFIDLQPIVDLRDGSVHLFEALARLRLPDGSTAQPNDFLPHLTPTEEQALFRTVLHQALEVLSHWDREGRHHNISVNLPPIVLQNPLTPAIVKELLELHDVAPARLGLEILESQVMNLDVQRAAIEELVRLGVGLAIDDLAAGHSSLQRLASFPFTALKLDKGLFGSVYEKPLETLSIMATLIQMGRDLDMNVVIEGLEDDSLTEAAIILGAPLGQGFFFTRPRPPATCHEWVDSFALTLHQTPIQTLLGALAYHWQFARLHSPHPLELRHCPLTRFIMELGSPADVHEWHEKQHADNGIHPASSRLLIGWLSRQIRSRSLRNPGPGSTDHGTGSTTLR